MRDIGKNIRDLRQRKNMTQDDLAEKLYVTRQTVSNYELGRTRPDIDMLVKIAEVLDTDVNAVLYGSPAPANRKRTVMTLGVEAGIGILLAAAYLWGESLAQAWKDTYWDVRLLYWVRILLKPAVFLSIGWTVMEFLGFLTKLSPIRNQKCRWVRIATGCIAGAYLLVMLPCLFSWEVSPRWMHIAHLILGSIQGQPFPEGYLLAAVLLGVALWLFRNDAAASKNRKETSLS